MQSPFTLVHADGTAPDEELTRRRVTGARGPARGDLVLDRYRLLEPLGSGGFGVVWRAEDESLHRHVAVKRIHLGAGGDSIDAERATREALATARLAHPAIVSLYEAHAEADAFYLISELVEGDTLAALIADDAIDDQEILRIALALADALGHAHARGVVHRDIKPHNVLVPEPGDGALPAAGAPGAPAAKLTDFGGATLVDEDALTRTGDVLGTLAYMAPEQSEGREVSPQSDLYSLALVVYEALSGVNPVRGATPAATARRIGTRLEPLHRHRRDLPRALTAAVDRALDASPRRRGTLAELREALALAHRRTLDPPPPRRRPPSAAAPPPSAAAVPAADRAVPAPYEQAAAPAAPEPDTPAWERDREPVARRPSLPRGAWLAAAVALAAWQALAGRAGLALLLAVALAPLLVFPAQRANRLGLVWLAGTLAPVLGLAGLAAAFPALAGQARRWTVRFALGALGYWWLTLSQALLDRRLWLGLPAHTPPRAVWEHSLGAAAAHVIAPRLTLGVTLGVLLWAAGAAVLPWLVRGRAAALDLIAVAVWSGALVALAPALDSGLAAHTAQASPRGAILGAVLGAAVALAARALRGPV